MRKLEGIFKPSSPYQQLFLSIILIGLSFGLYKGVLDNYLAEIVSLSEFDRGVSEFFRELPGLALVFLLAALYMLSAESIYKLGAAVLLAGLVMHAVVPPNRILVTLAICIYSLGEHIQLGMKSTLSLQYARPGRDGEALGIQSSVNQIGTLLGFVVIIVLFLFVPSNVRSYRWVFVAATLIAAVGVYACFRVSGNSRQDSSGSRFYFHRKYTKYYFLEVFYGARKQVFLTFGPYVLILFYGASTTVISLLFAVSAVCCFFLSPLVGKLIDRIGYKTVMVADTLILVIVCFFYGFAHHLFSMQTALIVCCINYIFDSIISLASMASNVYVKDLADSEEEVKLTLSTGISVNHLITILIALFGGWIWKTLGIETLFILSAVLGLCNSAYALSIKTSKKLAAESGGARQP